MCALRARLPDSGVFARPQITGRRVLSRFIATTCYTQQVPTETPSFIAEPIPDVYVTHNRVMLHNHLAEAADVNGRVLTTTVRIGAAIGLTTSVVQHTLNYLVQIGLATYQPGSRGRLAVITLTPRGNAS